MRRATLPLVVVACFFAQTASATVSWCIAPQSVKAYEYTKGWRAALDDSQITLTNKSDTVLCPAVAGGFFECQSDFARPCDATNKCRFYISIAPEGAGRFREGEIAYRDASLAREDLSGFELWMQREYDVQSEIIFHRCPQ